MTAFKSIIKTLAASTREIRREAHTLSGMARYNMQREADENAYESRTLLLAYGFLRGLTFEQMESSYSDPSKVPSADAIWARAEFYYWPQTEGESDASYQEAKDDLRATIEADRKRWVKQLTIKRATRRARSEAA